MNKFLLIAALNFGLFAQNCFAQNKNSGDEHNQTIDSLLTLIKKDKADTNKVIHLNKLSREYINIGIYDTALYYGNFSLQLAQQLNFKKGVANSYGNIGLVYYYQTNYSKTLDYYFKALKIDEELIDKRGIANHLDYIGTVYANQGDFPKALDYYFKSLKMVEELGDKYLISVSLGNIGSVYSELDDYPKALDYHFKALKIAEELGDKYLISSWLGAIGGEYYKQGDYPKALDYYFKALKIAEELGDKYLISILLGNIGGVYFNQGNYYKALDYYFKALEITTQLGDKDGIAINLGSIGSLYIKTGKFKEAETYLKKSIAIDDSIGVMNGVRQTEEALSQLYDTTAYLALKNGQYVKAADNYKLSMIYFKKAISLKDTLFSQENKKQLVRKEMNYEFDKKEVATKAEHAKEMAVADAEKKQQKIVIWLVISGLLLVIVFSFFMFNRWRVTQQQKNIIEKQKEKIIDSITYAQRIQQSILMEESEIQSYLPDSFIYFQPKDIVSGDFYWCSKINDKIIIAAVDCTGHGVPGAFMSMVGNTLLNQIVNEKRNTTPSEILQLLNIGVHDALHQEKGGALSDDGMDISLCCIDRKNNEIQFAGAQNPLYIVINNNIEVIKGNIHGIGGVGMIANKHDPTKIEFTNHVISIKKDMSIYIFSDGYMDQFGGRHPATGGMSETVQWQGKKFGIQKFKDLLLNNQHLSMQKQKEVIASAHIEWKGNTTQIDDILVIGVRI